VWQLCLKRENGVQEPRSRY
jgi:hypothetical protein